MRKILLIISVICFFGNTTFAQIDTQDSLALVALYNATDGDSWNNNDGWLTGQVAEWYGVQCVSNRIGALSLSNNNLTGIIPNEIINLSELNIIDLSHNKLSDGINLLGSLTQLLSIDISNNFFVSGGDLSQLYMLNTLIVNNNRFTFDCLKTFNIDFSSLSTFIYAPQTTTEMDLDVDYYGNPGIIGLDLSKYTHVFQWYKDGNKIDGANSHSLTTSLTDSAVYYCEVAPGDFPDIKLVTEKMVMPYGLVENDLEALVQIYKSIESINESLNWFNGSVQNWHGIAGGVLHGHVRQIHMREEYRSRVKGTLAPEIGNLKELRTIDFVTSKLEGDIPEEIANLSNLQYIDFMYNNLRSLPDFSNLNALTGVYIQGNNFDFGDLENCKYDFTNGGGSYERQKEIPFEYSNRVITVSPDGTDNTYQWYKNDTLIAGAVTNSYTITDNSQNFYQCEVKNAKFPELTLKSIKAYLPCAVPKEEYDALVALYNNTKGDNWTNHTNWLSDKPVSEWYRVTTDGYNVKSIELDNNNLDGELGYPKFYKLHTLSLTNNKLKGGVLFTYDTDKFVDLKRIRLSNNSLSKALDKKIALMPVLEQLLLENNEWDNLPDLSALKNLKELSVENNHLTFEHIEPYIGLPLESFSYSPQAKISDPENLVLSIGETGEISVKTGGENNSYQWFKDGVVIPDTNNDTLVITNFQMTDSGKYYCEISNSKATDLVLKTDTFTVTPGFDVNFTVTDKNGPMPFAEVALNDSYSGNTDDNGKITFVKTPVAIGHSYVIYAGSHDNYSGTFDVIDNTVNIDVYLTITGMFEPTNASVKIFPNPSVGQFTVDLGNLPGQNNNLVVYDLSGKTICTQKLEKSVNQIFLPENYKGAFIIQITDDKKVYYQQKLFITK